MCLAIYKPANKKVPTEHLAEGFCNNSHGAGFSYLKDGAIVTKKGFFKYEDFQAAYDAEVTDESPALIHFRLATHGKKNEFNCHPWSMLDGEYSVIHNGIINITSTDEKSDTGHFVDLVMTPLVEKFGSHNDGLVKYLVEETIGSGNKIVSMSKTGDVMIFNEDSGTWDDGIWYSNTGYQRSRYCGFSRSYDNDAWWGGGAYPTVSKKSGGVTSYDYSGKRHVPADHDDVTDDGFPDWDGHATYYNAVGTEVCDGCGNGLYQDEIITCHEHYGSICENCSYELKDMEDEDYAGVRQQIPATQ
jgi:glutamine amidotransferase